MRTFPQMAAKYTFSRKKTRRTVHYQITEEAVAGQKKENSSLTSIPSGTDQPKSTGRNMRFQKGLTFFQQRTVELFFVKTICRGKHIAIWDGKSVRTKKVTHHTCNNFTNSEGENNNIDTNSYGEKTSCITNTIAM